MKTLVRLFVVFAIAFTTAGVAVAQESSPAPSLLAGLDLPTIEISITSEGITAPAEAPSGPSLLVIDNQTSGFTVSSISQLPEGVTNEEYLSALTADAFPDWTADVVVAGGLDLPPMTTGTIAVDLAEGTWLIGVVGDEPIGEPIAELVVTAAETTATIPADLDVELGAYVFDIPDQVASGPQIWRVFNSHAVLHHIVLLKVDRLYTTEEAEAGLMADLMGTPAADGLSLSTAEFLFASSAISEGQTIWIEVAPEPGYYVALCFLPDPGGDLPHAAMGMIDTFEVPE